MKKNKLGRVSANLYRYETAWHRVSDGKWTKTAIYVARFRRNGETYSKQWSCTRHGETGAKGRAETWLGKQLLAFDRGRPPIT